MIPPVWIGLERRWALFGKQVNDWAATHLWKRPERFKTGTTGRQVGKCLRETALVHMADGTRKEARAVRTDDRVLSWNGTALVPSRVTHVIDNGVQPLYEVVTRRGRSTIVTGNHPILARRAPPALHLFRRGKNRLPEFEWINADEIRVGDEIAPLPENHCIQPEGLGESVGWVLGALVGDGSTGSASGISFTNADVDVVAALAQRFALTQNKKTPIEYYIKQGVPFAREHGLLGKTAHDKVVPDTVLRGGTDAWCGFLAGMLDTDGTVDRLVEWYSVSYRLLDDMRMLLAYLGVTATLSEKNGRYQNKPHKSWRLTVSGKENVLRLSNLLRLRGVKRHRLSKLADSKLGLKPNRRGERDFVKSVQRLPMEPTIGLTVEGTHTHVTDNMITHNTEELARRVDAAMNAPMDPEDRTGDPVPFVGVLGSNYQKAELGVNRYIDQLTQVFGTGAYRLNQNRHELTIRDPAAGVLGAKLQWLSAEEAYNVVGFTFSHVCIDEAQAIPDEVWFKLRPTLDVRNAGVDVFGTPDITEYQTWFHGLWLRGQDPMDTDYGSYTVASWEAPWMSPESILDAKRSLPEIEFRRLYGGEWVQDAGLVFTSVASATMDPQWMPQYDPQRKYVMGVDLAVYDDFNVVFVGDPATGTVIYKDRWNYTDPLITYDRIQEIYERFGRPKAFVDESGAGIPMVRELRSRGIRVTGVTIGSGGGPRSVGKLDLVQSLASAIQHRRIMFPADWDDLKRELGSYVYGRTPTGKLTANAAAGAHDDMVIALALLNYGFRNGARSSSSSTQSNYLENGSAWDRLLARA